MARQAPWSDQHQVESEVEAGEVGPRAEKGFSGARDTAALARGECRRRYAEVGAGFDLDDCEHPAAAGDDVYFARWTAPALRDNSPAAQPQMPEAQPFRQPSPALGASPARDIALSHAPHCFWSRISSARR